MRPSLVSLDRLTRAGHSYVGLSLLAFLWLLCVSGLLLNHHWSVTEFWESRARSTVERAISRPAAQDDVAMARALMEQLDLGGEIEWTQTNADPNRFVFRITKAGQFTEVTADLAAGKAILKRTQFNGWGILRSLHTSSRPMGQRAQRDWWLTSVWFVALDAVAAGLIVLGLSGAYLAIRRRMGRVTTALLLAIGALLCIGFLMPAAGW